MSTVICDLSVSPSGTATEGTDFDFTATTISIPVGIYDGVSSASSFPVPIIVYEDTNIGEPDETVIITIDSVVADDPQFTPILGDPCTTSVLPVITHTITDSLPTEITAADYTSPVIDGLVGDSNVVNAFDNDTLGGTAVVPADILATVTTPATSINGGSIPVMDETTGIVSVPAGTTNGTYEITYEICEVANLTNCDTAVVTVVVASDLVARPPLIPESCGLSLAEGFNTLGAPVTDSLATFGTGTANDPFTYMEMSRDATTGIVEVFYSVADATKSSSGSNNIIEELSTTNQTTTIGHQSELWRVAYALQGEPGSVGSLTLETQDAQEWTAYWVSDTSGNSIANGDFVLTSSTSNGAGDGLAISFTYPGDGIAYLNLVVVDPTSFHGNYAITDYTCPTVELSVDKTASTLTSPVAAGDAITYTFEVTNSGEMSINDVVPVEAGIIIDGAAGTGTLSNYSVITEAGFVSTDANNDNMVDILAPSELAKFTATYTLTQSDVDAVLSSVDPLTAIANTATATGAPLAGELAPVDPSGVTTGFASIVTPDNKSGTTVSGIPATPIADVIDGDMVNGQPAQLGTGGNATISEVGTWPVGITLNPATGAVSTDATVLLGIYVMEYELCDLSSPTPVCEIAMVTVTVTSNLPPSAGNDSSEPNQAFGQPVTVETISNDSDPEVQLDPASVRIQDPSGNPVTMLVVLGEGTWTVDPSTGAITFTPEVGFVGDPTPISYTVRDTSGLESNVATVSIDYEQFAELEDIDNNAIVLTKSVNKNQISIGDQLYYTIVAENTTANDIYIDIQDKMPAGFTFTGDTVELVFAGDDGVFSQEENAAVVSVTAELSSNDLVTFGTITIPASEKIQIGYILKVGTSVQSGESVNTARAYAPDSTTDIASNQTTASVTVVTDSVINQSTLVGKVFHDRDSDGYQDPANVTGLSVKSDYFGWNSLQLGGLNGRVSILDNPNAYRKIVHMPYTMKNDFKVTTQQGTVLKINHSGQSFESHVGQKAKGLTSQDIRVTTRRIQAIPTPTNVVMMRVPAKVMDVLEITITNHGIHEEGIPGVRLATVKGLLIETDGNGRYHVPDVDGGKRSMGKNFIIKVDIATLPEGAQFTTENPRVLRLTSTALNKINFGVKLPVQAAPTSHSRSNAKYQTQTRKKTISRQVPVFKTVNVKLGSIFFDKNSHDIRADQRGNMDLLISRIKSHGKGHITIDAHTDSRHNAAYNIALAKRRAQTIRGELQRSLGAKLMRHVKVDVDTSAYQEIIHNDKRSVDYNVRN